MGSYLLREFSQWATDIQTQSCGIYRGQLKSSWITVSVRKKPHNQSWFGSEGAVCSRAVWSTSQDRFVWAVLRACTVLCWRHQPALDWTPAGWIWVWAQLWEGTAWGPLWNQRIFPLCVSFYPKKANHFSFLSCGRYGETSGALFTIAVADWGNQPWRI